MLELMQLLEKVGGVIDNSHVVYTSRKHGRAYVNWVAVLENSQALWETSLAMTELPGMGFATIAGPTHTGDKVANALALAFLHKGVNVAPVYVQEITEKVKAILDGREQELEVVRQGRTFPRGQIKDVKGHLVLVVDDVLTTGKTARETIEAVQAHGGTPTGVLVGCNRSAFVGSFDGFPLWELLKANMEQWDPEECQACIDQVLMNTSVGHGKEWVEHYPDPTQWPAFVKANQP